MPVVRVVKVLAMAPGSGEPAGVVKTDTQGELTVERRKDWTTLEMGFLRGWVMGVRFEDAKVVAAWPADTDQVRAVGSLSDPGERLAVDLMKRQTILYLNRADSRFRALYAQLEAAVKAKAPVAVAVGPGEELIEDVRS